MRWCPNCCCHPIYPQSQSHLVPHSGIKFSCLTKADPRRFFLSHSQHAHPAAASALFILVAWWSIGHQKRETHGWKNKKKYYFSPFSKLFLNKVRSLLDFQISQRYTLSICVNFVIFWYNCLFNRILVAVWHKVAKSKIRQNKNKIR